uniref:Uncharacterized protein n=1 Tax=Tanacetum cinerariifolium TaxID=118510 RepID=A0A6L2L3T9_TANCI|nr:hypothetical protein [Tanacetum cinerariifolium]
MGEPLSPDRVLDFLEDELEPRPAYDFFVPAPLLGYASEQMIEPAIKEVVEPVAEAEEEQVIAPMANIEEGQMDVLMIDIDEYLAVLFGKDDDFENDDFENDSKGVAEEEAWEVNEKWLMAPVTAPSVLAVQPSSVYKDFSTRLDNLEYWHGQLVLRVNQVSDVEIAADVTIGELGPRVYPVEGQVQVMASQMVHAADTWEQVGAQVE